MRGWEIIFPLKNDRPYGLASAAFLCLLILDEIEGLAFVVLALVARRVDLFLDLQIFIFPASFFVAASVSAVVYWRARRWRERMRYDTEELATSMDPNSLAERIGGATRPLGERVQRVDSSPPAIHR